jgi:hypothetical protein
METTAVAPSSTRRSLSPNTRGSLDSERDATMTPPLAETNGVNDHDGSDNADDDTPLDPLERLRKELQRTREEKENLASQYRNLLSKLTTMRTTLGNKLKQDAVRYLSVPPTMGDP